MEQEIWKDIPYYEGLYQASTYGNIRSLNYKGQGVCRQLVTIVNERGYKFVNLYIGGKRKYHLVHRIILITFTPNPLNKQQVNHKNGIKTDNRLENLEWCTASENGLHAYKHGLSYIGRNNIFMNNHPTRGLLGGDHYLSKKVVQYSLGGEYIRTWGSFSEIQRMLGIAHSSVGACCRGTMISAGGFIWKYADKSI